MLDKISKVLTSIFGTKSARDLKKLWPVVDEINSFEDEMKGLTDEELKQKTESFRALIKERTQDVSDQISEIKEKMDSNDESISLEERREFSDRLSELEQDWLDILEDTLDEILPEAYAVLKDTCRRFVGKKWKVAGTEIEWDMIPYDVQLIGAVAMHKSSIAEMKTGEGKTLAAIFPAYLNALAGRGVHVITVNTYLAQRDAEWNEPIFNFHGLHVDCVDRYNPNTEPRRKAYRADITYGTNNEFGFDYLRDNMVIEEEQLVQRDYHYAIIDEVDSILIDEARTPLIISGPVPQSNSQQKYEEMKPRVESLVKAQKALVASLVNDAERLHKEGKNDEAGLALYRAERGFPKNKKFRKLMQEAEYQRLVQQTESFYLADNAKNLPIVDEHLYYAVDMKQKSIEMTEKGRDFITKEEEGDEFFVIPDLGTETSEIEEEMDQLEKEKIEEIRNNDDFSDDYKEKKIEEAKTELKQEREKRFNELHRLFAERGDRIHTVNQLLKAYTLFEKEEEYIVQDGKVQIVDEHTGRVLSGRRYSDGLHQAIEAKEEVKVEAATQTYATITLQNYFRMYHKLSGMTGTAATEEGEFNEIYDLDVTVIPTNKPIIRDDREDLIFRTKREKYKAVINTIRDFHEKGQPVLVGTTSVDVSEQLSRMLKRAKIPHNVLNAKQHARESEIVAQAGQIGAVTVATNMAGRGTDIKLSDEVKEKGGLAILGTARHESRRIDLQLRGRAGRQGDPGMSQFYVSLEDELMTLFGGTDRIANIMDKLNFEEGEVIQHPWVSKSLERAQKKVEQNNFAIRKRQLEFDDVLNNQRNVVYSRRKHALLGDQLQSDIFDMLEDMVEGIVDTYYPNGEFEELRDEILRQLAVEVELDLDQWAIMGEDGLVDHIIEKAYEVYRRKERLVSEPLYRIIQQIQDSDSEKKPSKIQVIFTDGMRRMRIVVDVERASKNEGREVARSLERSAILSTIDNKWMEHLRELDTVKEGIGLRSFGQKDPLMEYKKEAFEMFKMLIDEINKETTSLIWKAVPEVQADQGKVQAAQKEKSKYDMSKAQAQQADSTNMGFRGGQQADGDGQQKASAPGEKRQPVTVDDEPGRNDHVKLQNINTQEVKDVKWKYAKKMVNEGGWVVIEK
ncbi:preprotein translocase subunit SecA [Rhodohalobacter barkolensis]|uniref:Protein translocase subunit SecA n=1 Tax=Rhodohalobacter barkolensis TaxID=2053187 RepID=A0A2N0VEL4_9BACT|nr:preprotein translocase subunit SecA [Rhodohalobacter barkolensis]PKD42600.1 preprotein translocase subunit SecA [Rhodohalobacter barkolensis]